MRHARAGGCGHLRHQRRRKQGRLRRLQQHRRAVPHPDSVRAVHRRPHRGVLLRAAAGDGLPRPPDQRDGDPRADDGGRAGAGPAVRHQHGGAGEQDARHLQARLGVLPRHLLPRGGVLCRALHRQHADGGPVPRAGGHARQPGGHELLRPVRRAPRGAHRRLSGPEHARLRAAGAGEGRQRGAEHAPGVQDGGQRVEERRQGPLPGRGGAPGDGGELRAGGGVQGRVHPRGQHGGLARGAGVGEHDGRARGGGAHHGPQPQQPRGGQAARAPPPEREGRHHRQGQRQARQGRPQGDAVAGGSLPQGPPVQLPAAAVHLPGQGALPPAVHPQRAAGDHADAGGQRPVPADGVGRAVGEREHRGRGAGDVRAAGLPRHAPRDRPGEAHPPRPRARRRQAQHCDPGAHPQAAAGEEALPRRHHGDDHFPAARQRAAVLLPPVVAGARGQLPRQLPRQPAQPQPQRPRRQPGVLDERRHGDGLLQRTAGPAYTLRHVVTAALQCLPARALPSGRQRRRRARLCPAAVQLVRELDRRSSPRRSW
mmetsp:Transcript_20053/g.43875  ORF Transcript_20053/g.43875 Transcript_20053/m.43875 type:complete len:540 (-) Transcript_20053:719-2338(-)